MNNEIDFCNDIASGSELSLNIDVDIGYEDNIVGDMEDNYGVF